MPSSAIPMVAQAKRNLRIPLLLLWLLLVTTLGVAGLTFYALRGQRAELDQARDAARQHLASLLAGRIDHALQTAIHEPLLRINQARGGELSDARLANLQRDYPYLDAVLVLDERMQALRSRPALMNEYQQRLIGWVTERLQAEVLSARDWRTPVRTFVESVDGEPAVFAFLPLQRGDNAVDDPGRGGEGWVLVQADYRHLRRHVVDPIVQQFEREHGVNVRLSNPASVVENREREAGVPVSVLIPGWTLGIDGPPQAAGHFNAMTRHAIVAASAGLLLAIVLICAVIAWDLRREYALVDLRNRFVANVSHELRTPLSLIRMYAETLSMRRIPDPDRQQRYLQMILSEAERLSAMIGDVLDFARLRQGLPTYRLSDTALGETVDAVVREYLPEWARRGARLSLSIDGALPPVAHDASAIRQVLLNLVDNAIEHGGNPGDVRVAVTTDGSSVRLSVTDHGRGLTDTARRELQRSMRKGQVASQASGSGLGLALVQQISNAHRARFELVRPDGHDGVEAALVFRTATAAA